MAIQKYETGGGVVIRDGHILLLDRPKRDEVRLPKGHIDPGETPELTALRETTEESGYVDLQIIAELGTQFVEFDRDGDHYIRTEHYFLMQLLSTKRVKRSENDEKQFRPIWVAMSEAAQQLTFPAEQQVVQKAIERYQQLGKDL